MSSPVPLNQVPLINLIALDTTGEHGSIALVTSSGVLEEVLLHSPEGFAHVLFVEIDALLSRHHLRINDIAAFATASGPGSFTGVRIGLTAAKGLAEATGRKVIPISNLRALGFYGTSPNRAVVIDARRGEIYGGVYNASLQPVQEELVIKLDAWLAGIAADPALQSGLEFITQSSAISEHIEAAWSRAGLPSPQLVSAPLALAGAIGRIALSDFENRLALAPELVDASYVRRSDAELLWREPQPRR